MDYDGNSTLYRLKCGMCGRQFWTHDASEVVCDQCKGNKEQRYHEWIVEECPAMTLDGTIVSTMLRREQELVRCKDCKWYDDFSQNCRNGIDGIMTPNFYCANAKRKEGR